MTGKQEWEGERRVDKQQYRKQLVRKSFYVKNQESFELINLKIDQSA